MTSDILDGDTTKTNIKALSRPNEKDEAKKRYDSALRKMLDDPTQANIDAFTAANNHYFEVQDRYRIAQRLLLERAKNLRQAAISIFNR